VARKTTQRTPKSCTFCGNPIKSGSQDHVFPRALWPESSHDRPPKVPSCKRCNNESNESILKHFFIVLDSRFYPETISHFKDPRGKGDFRTFSSMWTEIGGNYYLYINEQVTAKFIKMFMGIRRQLLRGAWFFVPAERFLLFKIDAVGERYESRPLPMRVGEVNSAQPLGAEFTSALAEPMQYKFRDFAYELFANDDDGVVLGIRYEREEFAELGNRLYLLCFVPNAG
jgi:hypothetical protein